MKTEIFAAGSGPTAKATLFFAGWGMDANPFRLDFPADRDCIVCHDYANLDFDPGLLRRYDDVLLAAWSMGVWAAAHVASRHDLRYSRAIAVNGTMRPIDDAFGIPEKVFLGTLAGLAPGSLLKFHRRMCASPEARAAFSAAPPQRDFADVRDELASLARAAVSAAPAMAWDCAVIGTADGVFPPANQFRAWEGTRTAPLPDGHYLSSWKSVFDGGIMA